MVPPHEVLVLGKDGGVEPREEKDRTCFRTTVFLSFVTAVHFVVCHCRACVLKLLLCHARIAIAPLCVLSTNNRAFRSKEWGTPLWLLTHPSRSPLPRSDVAAGLTVQSRRVSPLSVAPVQTYGVFLSLARVSFIVSFSPLFPFFPSPMYIFTFPQLASLPLACLFYGATVHGF